MDGEFRKLIDKISIHRNEILDAWQKEASKLLPAHLLLGTAESTNSMLSRVVEDLQTGQSSAERRKPTIKEARGYMSSRAFSRHLFRQAVFTVLEKESPLPPTEHDRLLTILDEYIDEAVSGTLEWMDLAMTLTQTGAWMWPLSPDFHEIIRTEIHDKIFGIESTSEPWTLDKWRKAIHPEDLPSVEKAVADLVSGARDKADGEHRIIRANDGKVRWVRLQGGVVKDAQGKVLRCIGIINDITDHRTLQRNRDEIVAALSHDMRNPLAAVQGFAQLLARDPELKERQKALLNRMSAAIGRVDRMITDLLDTSAMQEGEALHLTIEKCDLAELLTQVVVDFAVRYGDRFKANVTGSYPGEWACDGLRRVIENLVGNAVKYGDPRAPITLALSRLENEIVISVHNQGTSISPEDQKTIFEPFKRTKASITEKRVGWGLGLTLVRGVAETLHGRAEVRSAQEEGTTFSVIFPAQKESKAA